MAPLQVHIKHAGKTHDVQLDPDLPANAFKENIYQVTGVPVDRMKVMVKGGVLKDDTPWKKIGPKAGQTFTVIGAAGELPKPPEKPIVFLEDMDDTELAEALAKPVGLKNLGNTCYMNATVQALRAIPELQTALSVPALRSDTPLPGALRDLYHNMSRTTDSITPLGFLQILRQVNPQFGEMDRSGKGAIPGMGPMYSQQDAEECYNAIIHSLRNIPGLSPEGTSISDGSAQALVGQKRFVEQYLMGQIRRELTCDEAPEEPATYTTEQVLKVECNISNTTNYMLPGIMSSLDTKVDKNSPTLGRQAVYSQKSRMTRLPAYLTVHMVRFYWRADISKKTKIMRKVKFPTEFDASDLTTDELKGKLLPVSRNSPSGDVEMADAVAPAAKVEGELDDENVYREKEINELEALVDSELKADIGCSVTGLYDLVAIVTHKGAAADAGHYIGFVKKSDSTAGKNVELDEDDEDWYKFDDEKVSVFPKDKLATLDGGGEDSSAYVLLYRTKPLE
ncbi:hypothetical protein BDQ17DRAFT_1391450 [Cyathus striatus]|nr:hypothetical protein BDQ17DRAFT_1391450 [Cyathus striatus]